MQVVNTSQEAALVKLAEQYGHQDTLEILNSSSVEELKAINSWLIQLEQYQEQEARNSEPDYSEGEENPDFPALSDLASSEEDSSDEEEECSALSDSELDQEYVNRERTCGALWKQCSELYLDDSLSLEQ